MTQPARSTQSTQVEGGGPELVVTLGPASLHLANALARAGASCFRLNASHMSPSEVVDALGSLRAALPELPLVVDLQGAKMRLGLFAERALEPGREVTFRLAAQAQAPEEELPIPHPELFQAATVGTLLSCDDDRLRFEVTAASKGQLTARCLSRSILKPRKSVNLVDHPVELADLCPRDLEHLTATAEVPDVTFAISFMRDGREASWLRRRRPGCRVIGKVERREAITNLEAIAAAVDALWICRGDLGAQLGAVEMARFVADLDPRSFTKPVLMAGQVLEHLTQHAEPTRSEVCHLFDLLARGYAGIVLSDETAIGVDPLRAVQKATGLLAELSLV